jgi:LytS/YehU family sensor histidine kinase
MDLEYMFVMIAWTAGYMALMLLKRNQSQREALLRQEVDIQRTRLSLLAAQLNPHFLFNALNTIRSLASEDATRTREVVSRLSAFLRRVITVDPAVPVPLEQEIQLAHDYLDVEKARFESTLDVTFDIASGTAAIEVPPLILQPLLENAIKHGEAVNGTRSVVISAAAVNGELIVTVKNSGILREQPFGTGLDLTKARLQQTYGDRQAFELSQSGSDVIAKLTIPALQRR